MQNYSLARKNTEFFVSHTITAPTFADKVNVHSSSTLFDERANWKHVSHLFRLLFVAFLPLCVAKKKKIEGHELSPMKVGHL